MRTEKNKVMEALRKIETHVYDLADAYRYVDDMDIVSREIIEASARPTIVCLCGSTRFYEAFRRANFELTLAGQIVLTIGCDTKSDQDLFGSLSTEEMDRIKESLDKLHIAKIDLADEVLILNVGGYIGQSTRRELDYAISLGKTVRYLEPTMTTLSSLLSTLQSSPSLEALRQIPQPILIEWARAELSGPSGIILIPTPEITQVLCAQGEIQEPGSTASHWIWIPDDQIYAHVFGRPDRSGECGWGWICSLQPIGDSLSRLIALIESHASILSILSVLRARQASMVEGTVVAAWQAESEEQIY